jgi:hypothetical protein
MFSLISPRDIVNAMQDLHRSATFEGKWEGNEFAFYIMIPDGPKIRVNNCVIRDEFIEKIQRVVALTLISEPSQQDQVIKLTDISISEPLEWQSYQRERYEESGIITDLIKSYLLLDHQLPRENRLLNQVEEEKKQDPADIPNEVEDTLKNLGLAPNQLLFSDASSLKEEDYMYFEQIVDGSPEEEKQSLLAKIKSKYPIVFDRLFSDLGKKKDLENGALSYEHILQEIESKVIGQRVAAREVASILSQNNRSSRNRSYLFVGPTGVGKTEIANVMAEKGHSELVKFRMELYSDKSMVSSIFGSPVGYYGSNDKPLFAEKFTNIRVQVLPQQPGIEEYQITNTVILLDEIEKAHPVVVQSFLTILEEGVCEMSYVNDPENITLRLNFIGCTFICTSNAYQKQILSFFDEQLPTANIVEQVKMLNLQNPNPLFSPEFLGRVQIIPFGRVSKGADFQKIIKLQLEAFTKNLSRELNCQVIVHESPQLFELFEEFLYTNGTDIRSIKNRLSELITIQALENEMRGNHKLIELLLDDHGHLTLKFSSLIYGHMKENKVIKLLQGAFQ